MTCFASRDQILVLRIFIETHSSAERATYILTPTWQDVSVFYRMYMCWCKLTYTKLRNHLIQTICLPPSTHSFLLQIGRSSTLKRQKMIKRRKRRKKNCKICTTFVGGGGRLPFLFSFPHTANTTINQSRLRGFLS